MRDNLRPLWIALALLLIACGGSTTAPTRAPSPESNLALTATALVRRGGTAGAPPGIPTATNRPSPPLPGNTGPSATPVAVSIVAVTGAPPGRAASVRIQGPPNTVCSIEYFAPGGEVGELPGLEDRRTDASGGASWSWTIDPNTRPGMGRVIVFCGSAVGTGPITIG